MFRYLFPVIAGLIFLTACTSNDFGPDSDRNPVTDPDPDPDPDPVSVTYEGTIKPIISNNCLTCHGEFGSLNGVKSNIPEILRRIQLSPSSNEFMPKGGSKLSSDKIQAFKTWQQNGFPE